MIESTQYGVPMPRAGVRDHRAEDRDHQHRDPVANRVAAVAAQLPPQRREEAADTHDAGDRDAVGPHEVGAGLADAGGEQLDDPEVRNTSGTLGAKSSVLHAGEDPRRNLTTPSTVLDARASPRSVAPGSTLTWC